MGMKNESYATFRIQVPSEYRESPRAKKSLPEVFSFFVNPNGGLKGNSIAIFKQPVTNMDVKRYGYSRNATTLRSIEDLGSVSMVAAALVDADNGKLQTASTRKDNTGLVFYDVDYTRSLFGFQRRVLPSFTIADGIFYTIASDMESKTYDTDEGQGLRLAVSSLAIKSRGE